MREVEINSKNQFDVYCPMSFGSGNGFELCIPDCAWFSMGPETVLCDGVRHPNTGDKFAYCKDHCIGRIKK